MGNLIAGIDEKNRKPFVFFSEVLLQFIFLQAIRFPHEAFDAISIYSSFKMPAANAHPCL